MNQEERINRFMKLMIEAQKETGITCAAEEGNPLVLFDIVENAPIALEITVGVDVKIEDGIATKSVIDRRDLFEGETSK